jgi:hypothetical protein
VSNSRPSVCVAELIQNGFLGAQIVKRRGALQSELALALLVTWVAADNHDPTVATNHTARITDSLHTWFDLHEVSFSNSLSSYPQGSASRYFRAKLFVAINDATAGQVVGGQFYDHSILWEDANVVLTHFS